MRATALLTEAALNLARGTARAGIFALVLATLLSGLALADIAAVLAIEQRATAYQQTGGSTLVYSAQGRVDGPRCDALREVRGVRAAGALATAPKTTASAMPGDGIPTLLSSPGFGGFTALGGARAGGGVQVSDQVAEQLRLRPGSVFPTVAGTATVGAVYRSPDDGRLPGLGYAILMPSVTTARFDQCWAEVWPPSPAVEHLLSSVVLPGTGSGEDPAPELRQLNSSMGATFDGAGLFDGRITRLGVPTAAIVAGVLGFVSVRRRRLELASALHCGVRRADLTVQLSVETALWTLLAVGVTAAVTAGVVAALPTRDAGGLLALAVPVVLAGATATSGGAVIALAATREKHLFAYFKRR